MEALRVNASAILQWLRGTPQQSRIEDRLWLGRVPMGTLPDADHIISVMRPVEFDWAYVDTPAKPPYAVEHTWVQDVPDGGAVPLEQTVALAARIDEDVRSGRTVYVHCYAGVGRSAQIVAAYYVLHRGMGAEQAVRHLRERRSVVAPNAAQKAVLRECAAFKKMT